jgi:hypothetical protein
MADNVQNPAQVTGKSGSYTGDGSQNRAIPHGLGRIPSLVFVAKTSSNDHNHTMMSSSPTILRDINSGVEVTVTSMTAVNFYVGDNLGLTTGGNFNAAVYNWVAIP